jgi:hypothetical protein
MTYGDRNIETTDWATVEPIAHEGEKGVAHWDTRLFGDIRVRIGDYSPGCLADHWCEKGQVLSCLEGELHTELKDGRVGGPSSWNELPDRRWLCRPTEVIPPTAPNCLLWINGSR